MSKERQHYSASPALLFGDMDSILHPPWDTMCIVQTGVPVSESVNVHKAKEMDTASMLTMGHQDSWRRVYPEPEANVEVGATRGDKRIDHGLVPWCVAEHIQSTFTTPVGQADHQAVVLRLTPRTACKPSNLWKFPAYLREQALHRAKSLARGSDKKTRGWTCDVLNMPRALSTSLP